MNATKQAFPVDATVTEIKQKSSATLQLEGYHGAKITAALRSEGYAHYQSHSACSKANFEETLHKDGKRVNIIQAYFLGEFTDIRVSSASL
jgi:hypothetical protein